LLKRIGELAKGMMSNKIEQEPPCFRGRYA
jgi:hypothetical protein